MAKAIDEFIHASHPGHVLRLLSREEPYECNLCREPGFGRRYACTSRRCNYHLHRKCGHAANVVSHELFPGSTLSLQPQPGSSSHVCRVCGQVVRGISYRCSDRYFHPRCLDHPCVVTGDGGIQMRLSRNAPSECYRCRSKYVGDKVRGFSYVSSCGKYCYHVACKGINRRPDNTHRDTSRRTTSDNSARELAVALSNTRVTPAPRPVHRTQSQVTSNNTQTETHIGSNGGTETRVRRVSTREILVHRNSGTEICVRSASTSETRERRNSGTGAVARNNSWPEIPLISRREIRRLQQ